MKIFLYIFIAIFFFSPFLTLAQESKLQVFYFLNSPVEAYLQSEMIERIESVKEFWRDKVNWRDFDAANVTERLEFVRYNIYSLPVALVKCEEKWIRINRSEIFPKELNETIFECAKKLEIIKEKPKILSFWHFFLIFLGLIPFLIIYLGRKLRKYLP